MSRLLIIGGSDAGISAALRAREVDSGAQVTLVVKDSYPNFSICGIPYYLSGEVPDWHRLAHRTLSEITSSGIQVLIETEALEINATDHLVHLRRQGRTDSLTYDRLVIATGARPVVPAFARELDNAVQGRVHTLHTMDDARALVDQGADRLAIIGGGYIGLEVAEAYALRGSKVTLFEQAPHILPRFASELATLLAKRLRTGGVTISSETAVREILEKDEQLEIVTSGPKGPQTLPFDAAIIAIGVIPDVDLAARAGVALGQRGAISVDATMRTSVEDIYAAGDCVSTRHVLIGETYVPLGTTAHKQGRIAGENAAGGEARFKGSVGTQVLKVFDLVAAGTGLNESEALAGGYRPATIFQTSYDHKNYMPGATPISLSLTADLDTHRLLGLQMVGTLASGVHKRIDTAATAIFAGLTIEDLSDLDLSYSPPLGSPWDVIQATAQAWLLSQSAIDERPFGD